MNKICHFDPCESPMHAKELCQYHYDQKIKGYPLSVRVRLKDGTYDVCQFKGCNKAHLSKGLCSGHYAQQSAGKELRPLRKMAAKGTGHLNKTTGYRMIKVDGEPMLEHRYIMEQNLKRKLFSDENVHHLNGVRHDNRIENLELWSTSQPKGQRLKDKLEWAREIIARYEDS